MKIGPREQLIVWVLVAVVVVIGLAAGLVFPQIGRLSDIARDISEQDAQVAEAKRLVAVREQSKNRVAETDAKWMRMANLIPEGPDLPSLIVELQDAAFASGVQLIGVTPSDMDATPTYYTIPVQVEVLGTWADTVDFLQRMGRLNRGIRVVSLNAKPTNNDESSVKENEIIPDYAERTTVNVEAYMIPSSEGSATPSAAASSTPGQ
jgi:Tfp pilus assembly protein PilO